MENKKTPYLSSYAEVGGLVLQRHAHSHTNAIFIHYFNNSALGFVLHPLDELSH